MHFSSICFIISFLWMFLIFNKWWFLKEVFKKKFEMSRRNFSVSSRPVIRHSTSCSSAAWLFVCCWPWLLAVLSTESIIDIELSRWDFSLSLVLCSLSQQTTLSADESPPFFPEVFHRFDFFIIQWEEINEEMNGCRIVEARNMAELRKKLFHIDKKRRFKRKQLSDEVSKTVVSSKNGGRWEKFQSKTSHVSRIWRGL